MAVVDGARVLCGRTRDGALMHPTVLADVLRNTEMVACESIGPLAPILLIDDLDDAVGYYTSGNFGLSSAVVTNNLNFALKAAKNSAPAPPTSTMSRVSGWRVHPSAASRTRVWASRKT